MAKIVVRGGPLTWDGKPRGGHAVYILQWIEGLRRLGHDVLYHEIVSNPDAVGTLRYFVESPWCSARAVAVTRSGRVLYGMSRDELTAFVHEAQLLISLGAVYSPDPEPWLADIRPRLLVDQDPGFTHLWAAESGAAEIFGEHDVYCTVGGNIGTHRSPADAAGITWHHTWNPVVPEWWSAAAPAAAGFTTVASLWSQEYQVFDDQVWGPKADQLAKFADLPTLTGERFRIAVESGAGDVAELLRDGGWEVLDADAVAGTADEYRSFVSGSVAEFGCVKGLYVGTRSGWFSDRSACYLAAGRPVVVQDTGLDGLLPLGAGVHAVSDVEQAAQAVARVRRGYPEESAAARALAHECFSTAVTLPPLLELVGMPT